MDDNIRSFVELNEVSPYKAYITDIKYYVWFNKIDL